MRKGKEIDFLVLMRARERAAVLASFPTDTASGDPATFPDGAEGAPVKSLTVSFAAVQEGSGAPSPENIRPISGRTGLTLYHSGEDTSEYDELAVSWQSKAGAVYGGSLNVTTGVLTVDRVLATLDGSMSWTAYVSSGTQRGFLVSAANAGIVEDAMAGTASVTAPYILCSLLPAGSTVWARGKCGLQNKNIWIGFTSEDFDGVAAFKAYLDENPMQMVIPVETPVTYQLPPHQVRALLGENNIWSDAGNVAVEYRADLELYIEKRLGEESAGTLSLGAAPAVVRPGTGLEMQSLGLNDAGADYLGEPEEETDGEYYPEGLPDWEDTEEEEPTEEPEEDTEAPEPEGGLTDEA